jgi:hypothetical protein
MIRRYREQFAAARRMANDRNSSAEWLRYTT